MRKLPCADTEMEYAISRILLQSCGCYQSAQGRLVKSESNPTMLQSVRSFFERQPWWLILASSALLVLLIGDIDAITGPELNFSFFYLVPVCLVTWFVGARWGYFMAVASAGVCLGAEYMGAAVYTNPLLQEWNLLTRLVFFIASVWILSNWKSIGVRLAAMVEQRTAELR